MAVFAIDIGTCSCKMCKLTDTGCEMVPVTDGFSSYWGDNKLMLSAAYLDGENGDSLMVGQEAYNKCMLHPDWYIGEFKRQFDKTIPVLYTDKRQVTVDDIYIETLQRLSEIISRSGETVDTLVLTHPAAYAQNKQLIQRLVANANRAGFFEVQTIDEPSAAAANFQGQDLAEGENVLVYDFGGGTFDAALIRVEKEGFRHLSRSVGLSNCGGANIDELVQEDIRQELRRQLGADADKVLANRKFQTILEKTAVQVKHRLSGQASVTETVMISYDRDFRYTLTRETFNRLIEPVVAQTLDACKKIVALAGLSPEKIQRVVLVGGSSLIPVITTRLKQLFPKTTVGSGAHPEYMVCMGAAASVKPQSELVIRASKSGDCAKSFAIKIDHTAVANLKGGESYEKKLRPGNHHVEIASNNLFGGNTPDFFFDEEIRFDYGDALAIECTSDNMRVYWKQLAGVDQQPVELVWKST